MEYLLGSVEKFIEELPNEFIEEFQNESLDCCIKEFVETYLQEKRL